VCLCVREDMEPRAIFTEFLCTLPMAVARSSSEVVAIRYVLLVLWMTSCFLSITRAVSRYEFRCEKPISLKFTYLPQSRTKFNFLLLKGIILINYFKITHKLK